MKCNIGEFRRLLLWAAIGILAMLLSSMLSSCRTRTVYVPVETKVLDSIVLHDTTFQEKLVPYKDSVAIADTASFLCNPYAYSYANYSNGMLHHSLGIYPFATVRVNIPYFIEKIRRIEVPKPYPVEKELSWWDKFKVRYGNASLFANLVCVVLLVFKMRKKLKM